MQNNSKEVFNEPPPRGFGNSGMGLFFRSGIQENGKYRSGFRENDFVWDSGKDLVDASSLLWTVDCVHTHAMMQLDTTGWVASALRHRAA